MQINFESFGDEKDGALTAWNEAQKQLEKASEWVHDASDEEELDYRRQSIMEMTESLLGCLGSIVFFSNSHDGDVRLSRDSEASWFFHYPRSGYHGGIIFHPKHDDADGWLPVGRWSVHT